MAALLTGVQLSKRGFVATMIAYFPLFAWYYVFPYYLLRFIVNDSTEAFSIYNASFNFLVFLSLILSSSFIHRIEKTYVMYAWSIFSSIGTIFIALAPTILFKLAIYLLSGVVFGMGLLAFSAYFWNLTVPQERGRVAGLIGFIFLPILSLVVILASNLDFFGTIMLCIFLNLGPLAIKPLDPKKITILTGKKNQRGYDTGTRTVLLYLIPWVMFSLINTTLATAVSFHISQYLSPSLLTMLWILQVAGGSLGAIISGIMADLSGRRPSLAFGFTCYGISSAISGVAKSYEMLCIVFIGCGLAWGALITLYLFVIWGDLATSETCARRYSVGLAIFYAAMGIGTIFTPQLLQIPLMTASIFSCLLIFLAYIPFILAPEVLPSDLREKIRLNLYIYLAKKKEKKLQNQK